MSEANEYQEKIARLENKIDKLKKENQALKDLNDIRTLALKNSQVAFFKFELKSGRFLYIDDEIENVTGFKPEHYYKKRIKDYNKEVFPEDMLKVSSLINKLKDLDSIDEPVSVDVKRKCKDGKIRPVNFKFTFLKRSDKITVYGLISPSDSSKNTFSAEIEKQINQFILDSTPNLIYVIDPQGRFLMVNEAMSRLFEMDKEKLINRLNSDFVSEKDEIELLDKIGSIVLKTNKPKSYIEKFTSPSGKVYWLQTIKAPLRIGNKTYILANSTDITERKRMESDLKQNENFLRSIINATDDFIVLCNKNGEIIMANESMATNLETSVDKIVKRKIYDLIPGPLENKNHKEFGKLLDKIIQTKKAQRYEYISYDQRYYETVIYPVLQNDLEITRMVLNIRDISLLKKAELESKNALEKEKELNALKSGIISTVSHEFRTPISVLQSNLQLLYKYREKITMEEYETKQQLMLASIRHVNYMLDNISILDKNYRGVLEFNPDYLDFEKLCIQIVEEIDSITPVKKRIMFKLQSEIGMVKMDEKLLRHIITNLLVNALKYSEEDKPVAFITQQLPGKVVLIKIIDQGIGIKQSEIQNIWEPFYRGSNTNDFKGTGIGNSIVKSCVELHKGKIELQSKEGKGTSVSIELPFESAFSF